MKATNFQKVNTNTVHIYSTWHSVPDGYDSTLDVWREFICDDYDLFADDESKEEWKKDVRAQVEAEAKKEFPYVMWEEIEIWYFVVCGEEKVLRREI